MKTGWNGWQIPDTTAGLRQIGAIRQTSIRLVAITGWGNKKAGIALDIYCNFCA